MIALMFTLAVAVQAPDSARAARWERAINQTTDSLDRMRGATAGFRADLASASPDLVLVRAATVRTACQGAGAPLAELDGLLGAEVYSARAQRTQTQLRRGTTDLRRVLSQCERDWQVPERPKPGIADSLRAWGPFRSAQIDSALRRYLSLVRTFMKQAALKKPAVS